MYGWYCTFMRPALAKYAVALTYAAMLVLVLYFVFEPEAEFSYLTL